MLQHGFVRVAAGLPRLRVADVAFNTARILSLMDQAQEHGAHLLVFPELALTGYSCADLFHHATLQHAALDGLKALLHASETRYCGVFVVGLPWRVGDQLFNAAAIAQKGKLLGVVPKTYLPNYKEFHEARWFTSGSLAQGAAVQGHGLPYCQLTADAVFADQRVDGATFSVEICEDLWVPVPPSSFQALAGAKILVNLSASNEVIGKAAYRRQLVVNQSGRCIAGYVYVSSGVGESSTDLVFGGHALIAENGALLAESARFLRDDALLVSDIDVQRLQHDRQQTNSFNESRSLLKGRAFGQSHFRLPQDEAPRPLARPVDGRPFVPRGEEQLSERCQDIFQTQVAGLAKRLEHIGTPAVSIGVSGGLDSTLALLVVCKTFDLLKVPRSKIRALTMPGFGTTPRTRTNATDLMAHLQVEARSCDIRALCLDEMKLLGHAPFGVALDGLTVDTFTGKLHGLPPERQHDLVFENVQARMRTNLLMNHGFVVGTGDLSELALGWCTYNGDHISMYNPNVSIPKTLVKFLVRWVADHEFTGAAQRTLLDIVATRISPELLPAAQDGRITQETESVIGPYELHDFFLFHFLRYAAPPEKILYLAVQAEFEAAYTPDEIRRWLRVFLQRFFASQFKRSCLPDGPKVGSVSLSPRGDWRMPSDAQAAVWLGEMED